jgi:hypothetical protein
LENQQDGDSGIYLRGIPQVQIWDPADPAQQRTNNKGSGGLWNNKVHDAFPSSPINPSASGTHVYPYVGPYVTVKPTAKVVDNVILENYFDAKSPIPSGHLFANAHHPAFSATSSSVKSPKGNSSSTKSAAKRRHKPIFNGKDLAGGPAAQSLRSKGRHTRL